MNNSHPALYFCCMFTQLPHGQCSTLAFPILLISSHLHMNFFSYLDSRIVVLPSCIVRDEKKCHGDE